MPGPVGFTAGQGGFEGGARWFCGLGQGGFEGRARMVLRVGPWWFSGQNRALGFLNNCVSER